MSTITSTTGLGLQYNAKFAAFPTPRPTQLTRAVMNRAFGIPILNLDSINTPTSAPIEAPIAVKTFRGLHNSRNRLTASSL